MKGARRLVLQNLNRERKTSLYCAFGISLGVGMFTFFLALSGGIQEEVLNRIYPINQLEVQPATVSVLGMKEKVGSEQVTPEIIGLLNEIRGVEEVSPKTKSHFRARLFGGEEIFGDVLKAEAFFDGLAVDLGQADLPPEQRGDFADLGESLPCSSTAQCADGGVCLLGECWDRGCQQQSDCGSHGVCVPVSCTTDSECGGEESSCVDGNCQQGFCGTGCNPNVELSQTGCRVAEQCVAMECESDEQCNGGSCNEGVCEQGYCERMFCELKYPKAQFSLGEVSKGSVDLDCAGTECEELFMCPEDTYCIAENREETSGRCEQPIPVILSPFLIEVFDIAVAGALGVEPLGSGEKVIGLVFQVQYGNSYLGQDRHSTEQVTKKAKIVGFSKKAMDLGLTVPFPYLKRANRLYGDGVVAEGYDSVVIEVAENGSVQTVLAEAKRLGLQASPRTREAESAASLLFWMTFAFTAVSWLILLVSALHVSQTFHMNVTRRFKELGILRSIGATSSDLRKLVVLEAALVGGAGGLFGVVVSSFIAYGLEQAILSSSAIKFRPEALFDFSPLIVGLGISIGLLFAVLGAWGPASRASKLDPAIVTK